MPPLPPGGAAPGGPGWGGVPTYSPVDAMAYGWKKFTQHLGPFIVMGLLIFFLAFGIQFLFNMLGAGSTFAMDAPIDPATGLPEDNAVSYLLQAVGGILSGIVSWVLGLALLRGALDVVDTGRTDLSAMFTRIPWGQALLAGLLVGIAVIVGLVALLVGALVVGFFLYYANAAVLDGKSATEAISASFTFVKEHLGDTLLYAMLAIVVIVITSCCTCGLATIVTTPVFALGTAYTWRVLQGRPVAP
ncbi:hypothetical protein [Janibacter limosus]|uniref:hypothetical protein n=1 Tax=Janibacter limosus TaxID=53458 RepID=UPI000AF7B2B5|nr:hypothetical protein [Janibacter limosus]